MPDVADATDDVGAQARELAHRLTARAGVPVAVVWCGSGVPGADFGRWDVCWSAPTPNVATMSSHVAGLAEQFPAVANRVRISWQPPSRRPATST